MKPRYNSRIKLILAVSLVLVLSLLVSGCDDGVEEDEEVVIDDDADVVVDGDGDPVLIDDDGGDPIVVDEDPGRDTVIIEDDSRDDTVVIDDNTDERVVVREETVVEEEYSGAGMAEGSCPSSPSIAQTEGPYYMEGSPESTDLVTEGIPGKPITITGYVFDSDCKPIEGAWLDFWQADGVGYYDNSGYSLRGHQYTDEDGKYTLRTVMPGGYPGRTEHIHVKIRADNSSPTLTTQVYFPDSSLNDADGIFQDSMVIDMRDADKGKTGYFSFRLG